MTAPFTVLLHIVNIAVDIAILILIEKVGEKLMIA